MKLKAVGGVTVGDLALEVRRQVDDGDRTERALLRADTATDTEGFRKKSESRFGGHFDTWDPDSQQTADRNLRMGRGRGKLTELAAAHDRTRLLAFLTTFLTFVLACSMPQLSCSHIGRTHLWLALLRRTWIVTVSPKTSSSYCV